MTSTLLLVLVLGLLAGGGGALAFMRWRQRREAARRPLPSRPMPVSVREPTRPLGPTVKPEHRRLALRDERFSAPTTQRDPWGRRPRRWSAAEAARAFSATLRTRNRQLRDLQTDAEQLARHGLPAWLDEAQLAEALGLPLSRLHHYARHREHERISHYVCFAVPKRSGGERLIMAPKRELKALQRRLNALLVDKLPVSDAAHGFRAHRSIATNARAHVGKAVVVRLDLQDFFPSLHFGRVRGLLVALGYSFPVATRLAVLMTECERQPVQVGEQVYQVPVGPRHAVQGAPTSPGLANALVRRMDHRLRGLAHAHGFAYTRYADDLAFSGEDPVTAHRLVKWADAIVRSEGFRLNAAKTQVMTQAGAQRVAGVTVNHQLGWSRRQRRRLRAELHQAAEQAPGDTARWQQLDGKLAFVRMLNPAQGERMQQRAREQRSDSVIRRATGGMRD